MNKMIGTLKESVFLKGWEEKEYSKDRSILLVKIITVYVIFE